MELSIMKTFVGYWSLATEYRRQDSWNYITCQVFNPEFSDWQLLALVKLGITQVGKHWGIPKSSVEGQVNSSVQRPVSCNKYPQFSPKYMKLHIYVTAAKL